MTGKQAVENQEQMTVLAYHQTTHLVQWSTKRGIFHKNVDVISIATSFQKLNFERLNIISVSLFF